jgi:hypothetical protein
MGDGITYGRLCGRQMWDPQLILAADIAKESADHFVLEKTLLSWNLARS